MGHAVPMQVCVKVTWEKLTVPSSSQTMLTEFLLLPKAWEEMNPLMLATHVENLSRMLTRMMVTISASLTTCFRVTVTRPSLCAMKAPGYG